MKKIIRLTESDLARIVKRVIKETEGEQPTVKVTPKVPSNLGFGVTESPLGEVVSWKNNQPTESWIGSSTNLIIKPGAKITRVKKGQLQVEGFLYFRKDDSKSGTKMDTGSQGPESTQAVRGKSIPKTIWFDCETGSFYVWFDSNKLKFGKTSVQRMSGGKFTETLDWFGQSACGYATQDELRQAFRS